MALPLISRRAALSILSAAPFSARLAAQARPQVRRVFSGDGRGYWVAPPFDSKPWQWQHAFVVGEEATTAARAAASLMDAPASHMVFARSTTRQPAGHGLTSSARAAWAAARPEIARGARPG